MGVKMVSSPMTTRVWIANESNYTRGRGGYNVNGIVIHHAVTTDINVIGRVFEQYGRGGSAHYGVGGREVHQYVDEIDTAWHCSNWWGNQNTIGIETVNSALGGDYPVSDETLETLCQLVADIARRYNLGRLYINPSEDCPKLSGHRDWQGAATACPGDYLYARLQYIADRANDINYPPAPAPAPTPEPTPAIEWHDVPETTLRIKDGGTDLINLENGQAIKHLDGDFTFVQQTADGTYVRTQYSKEKGINNGVLYSDLIQPQPEPTPKPEPEPTPEPQPDPQPEPSPEPEPSDDTPNWFIRFIHALGEFFINLFTKKEK